MRGYRRSASYDLTTSAATTPEIEWGTAEYGMVYVANGSSITTLTFHCAPDFGGTYEPAFDSAGTPAAITLTVAADRAVALPAGIRGCGWFKAVANAAGTVIMSFQE